MDNRIYVGDDGLTTTVEASDNKGSKTAVSEAEQQTTQSNTESQSKHRLRKYDVISISQDGGRDG